MTPQRRAVLEVMDTAQGHLDAATVMELARQRDARIDRATVYRTIELLRKLHLVAELYPMHRGGETRYEARIGPGYFHLTCFVCGRTEEFSSPLLDALRGEIDPEARFQVIAMRIVWREAHKRL